jgi:hypothetical protein
MKPVNPDSEEGQILIDYSRGALDAIGIKNGPSHGEIMMTSEGPCLVEINCRAHGWNGIWITLARALTGGYCQIDMTADALLNPEAFNNIPDKPSFPFKASGEIVMLVSHKEGDVLSTPGYEVLKSLPSYVLADGLTKVGSCVKYTIDLMTAIGVVVLMHEDSGKVQRDLAFIRHMEKINGFFTFKGPVVEETKCSPSQQQPTDGKMIKNTCDDVCEDNELAV